MPDALAEAADAASSSASPVLPDLSEQAIESLARRAEAEAIRCAPEGARTERTCRVLWDAAQALRELARQRDAAVAPHPVGPLH